MAIRFIVGTAILVPAAAMSGQQTESLIRGDASSAEGRWALTSQQVAYTETWLKGRSLNCLAGLGSPPTPSVYLHFIRSDGSELTLGIYSQPGYAKVVETHVGKKLCHYQGSESDVADLRSALDRPK